jgi:hypothetical protein
VVAFNHGLLKMDHEGVIVLEPVQAVVSRSWYTVDTTNNTFQIFDGTTINDYVVTTGWYNLKTFLYALTILLPSWSIGWDPMKSKYVFTPPNDGITYKMLFPTWLCSLLGFNLGEEFELSFYEPLTSTIPVKMTHESVLMIHCDVPKQKYSAVENLQTADMRESTVLLKVPLTCAPLDNCVWRSNGNDIISYELSTSNITSIRFWVTDEYNRPLLLPYDWTMTLRFSFFSETSDSKTMVSLLSSMRDYARLLILNTKSLTPSYDTKKTAKSSKEEQHHRKS